MAKTKCICKVIKGGWFFDFGNGLEEDNQLGEMIEKKAWLFVHEAQRKKVEWVKNIHNAVLLLSTIASSPKLNKWFLGQISDITGKKCKAWEVRLSMTLIDSKCPVHGKRDGSNG
jgi:hypothetical protein